MRGDAAEAKSMFTLVVVTVVAVGAALPVVLELVNTSGTTGAARTVLDLAPLFIGLLVLVAFAGPLLRMTR